MIHISKYKIATHACMLTVCICWQSASIRNWHRWIPYTKNVDLAGALLLLSKLGLEVWRNKYLKVTICKQRKSSSYWIWENGNMRLLIWYSVRCSGTDGQQTIHEWLVMSEYTEFYIYAYNNNNTEIKQQIYMSLCLHWNMDHWRAQRHGTSCRRIYGH